MSTVTLVFKSDDSAKRFADLFEADFKSCPPTEWTEMQTAAYADLATLEVNRPETLNLQRK